MVQASGGFLRPIFAGQDDGVQVGARSQNGRVRDCTKAAPTNGLGAALHTPEQPALAA
jgi:hypothetical protein